MCAQILPSRILCYIRENSKCEIKISTPTSKPKSQGLQHRLRAPLLPGPGAVGEAPRPHLWREAFPHVLSSQKWEMQELWKPKNVVTKLNLNWWELNGTELSGLNHRHFLTVLEAGKPQILFLVRALFLGCKWLPSHCALLWWREEALVSLPLLIRA